MTQRTINLYDGLEALYYFDSSYYDDGAGEIKDKSGHGRHAEASGGPTIGVEGPNGFEAASFDGSDDEIRAQDGFATTGHFTITVLAKRNSDGGDLFNIRDENLDPDSTLIRLQNNDHADYVLRDENKDAVASTVDVPNGWNMINLVAEGDDYKIVINNSTVAKKTDSLGEFRLEDISIGYDAFDGGRSYSEPDVSMFSMHNRSLNTAEIQYLNNLTAPRRQLL